MLHKRTIAAALGGAAVLGSLASTGTAQAVATPGQAVNNDYGQSPAEIGAEVGAVVRAAPLVITSRARYLTAHRVLAIRLQNEAKARSVYLKAVRSKKRLLVVRTKKTYLGARSLTARARAADAAGRTAYLRAVTSTTAAVRAKHYMPVDGVHTGDVAQYFIPGVGLEPIQVQITVYGGHVSDVTVPQYVSTGDSGSYNAMALPVLMHATMTAADTANVAAVSGASLTSGAFQKSLQSALTRAGFKG